MRDKTDALQAGLPVWTGLAGVIAGSCWSIVMFSTVLNMVNPALVSQLSGLWAINVVIWLIAQFGWSLSLGMWLMVHNPRATVSVPG